MSSNNSNNKDYELVVFGATGFTGKFVAIEAIRKVCCNEAGREGKKVVALAGRSLEKLKSYVKENISPALGLSEDEMASMVQLIEADVGDYDAVVKAVKHAKVCIMCAGPFRLYGEPVVKACVQEGTSYVDICGEPEFAETMELKYNEEAKKNGVAILSTCGFDSVPADALCFYASALMQKELNAVPCHCESYLFIKNPKYGAGNYATFESAILGMNSTQSLDEVRKKLSKIRSVPRNNFDKRIPKLNRFTSMFGTYDKNVDRFVIPFIGADASVVRRTQLQLEADLKSNPDGVPPVQYSCYICLNNGRSDVVKMTWYGALVKLFSATAWGQQYLLDHAPFFSGGVFQPKGSNPNEDQRAIDWEMLVNVRGASKTQFEGNAKSIKLDTTMSVKIQGRDPGYVGTAQIVVATALNVLNRPNDVSGVLTPAIALKHFGTNILDSYVESGAFSVHRV